MLGCDLKLLGCDWLTAIVTLQSLSKIQGRELSVCYESVLSEYSSVALQYPLLVTPSTAPDISSPANNSPQKGLQAVPSPAPHYNLKSQTASNLCAGGNVAVMAVGDKNLVAKDVVFAGSIDVAPS